MAYGSRQFVKDLALYTAGAAIGAKNSAKFVSYAAKKGIQLAGVGAARAATAAPGVAAANPITTGIGLGLGALATPPGQALLESAAQRGASDRVALQQAIDEYIFRQTVLPFREQQTQQPIDIQVSGRANVRDQALIKPRTTTTHNRNVKKAMKAVKSSKFGGPKGRISNAKKVFGTVNKTISRIKKGAKVSRKGITGVIARAIKK